MRNYVCVIRVLAAVLCWAAMPHHAAATDVEHGKWTVRYDETEKRVTLAKNGTTVLTGVSSKFKYGGSIYDTSDYGTGTVTESPLTDAVGSGKRVTITYGGDDLPLQVEQHYDLYDGADYVLTDVTLRLSGGGMVASNYIAPVFSEEKNLFLPQDAYNRFLTVPFDNDGFVTYGSYPLSRATSTTSGSAGRFARDSISFEVTAIFNGLTQQGMVIG